MKWATNAIDNWLTEANTLTRVVVAANDTATQSAILNASDNAILANIQDIIDALSMQL